MKASDSAHKSHRQQRIQADALLLLVSMVWGSAFVAQRIAASQVGAFLFNGARFLLAALVLAPFAWRAAAQANDKQGERKTLAGVCLAGVLLWAGAGLQQAGLQYTTAGNAGFITGLYVVLIPVFLALGWRHRLRRQIWVAGGMAAVGLFLLSTGGEMRLNPGDGLELVGAVMWALHVILISWLAQRLPVLRLAVGQYLVCGSLSFLTGLLFEAETLPALFQGWWAVAYTGIFSVALGYTLQIFGQRYAPPADAAIILSTESVFAALFGWIFLAEVLTPVQIVGCAVMFAGMLLVQFGGDGEK